MYRHSAFYPSAEAGAQVGQAGDEAHSTVTVAFPIGPWPPPGKLAGPNAVALLNVDPT